MVSPASESACCSKKTTCYRRRTTTWVVLVRATQGRSVYLTLLRSEQPWKKTISNRARCCRQLSEGWRIRRSFEIAASKKMHGVGGSAMTEAQGNANQACLLILRLARNLK